MTTINEVNEIVEIMSLVYGKSDNSNDKRIKSIANIVRAFVASISNELSPTPGVMLNKLMDESISHVKMYVDIDIFHISYISYESFRVYYEDSIVIHFVAKKNKPAFEQVADTIHDKIMDGTIKIKESALT